ncbi:MAG TPA: phosphoribosylaminoimidazolesuccinocarboxamide synthase [Candidatus Kapabacteria bacterium]|nr:phosphoribosylaminoimidazolesuccinocarboxamide synthase [Candidatus Kapabacteria bacterium]
MPTQALHTTDFPDLKLWRRGKVRDVYDLGESLLFVATDRISAYDVVMAEAIPGKGEILTAMSLFWFEQLRGIVPNHLITADVDLFPAECRRHADVLRGRSMLVNKTRPLPIECVARGYLAGSGWAEYRASRTVCGIELPEGLVESSRLPEPIFTPATKAEEGHDMNISYDEAAALVGEDTAARVRELTLAIYRMASKVAEQRGIIIADTKFEFGIDEAGGELILIDEVLTPDSSRFWLSAAYEPGHEQQGFDKQYLRDYLASSGWNKTPPPPSLPQEVIDGTARRYREALERLLGVEAPRPNGE